MDSTEFVARLRDHYVDQFIDFVENQTKDSTKGAAEVKLQLSSESGIYEQLYCVDFIKNEPPEIVELMPGNVMSFDPISGSIGKSSLLIEHFRWDDVVIYHDVDDLPDDQLSQWFAHWFDLDDKRHNTNNLLSDVIHSLLIEPKSISIDFGTSQSVAFWDMLELLEAANANLIRVSSSRAEDISDA